MMLEDFEVITDAIYCAMNSTKLLGICEMLLSHLKETTLHEPRWNNSPVSPLVPVSLFCRGLVFVYSVLVGDSAYLNFQRKNTWSRFEKT